MQDWNKDDSNQINSDFDEISYLDSYFYDAANNAINEINLIYSNQEEKDLAIKIIKKVFTNIIENPEVEKYFRFKISNPNIQKIINFQSTLDLFYLVGFKKTEIDGEEHLALFEYDKKVFSTIYYFIMLLSTGDFQEYNGKKHFLIKLKIRIK